MKSKLPSSLILLAAILLASCSNATVTSAPHPTGTEAAITLTPPSTSTQTPLPPAVSAEYISLQTSLDSQKVPYKIVDSQIEVSGHKIIANDLGLIIFADQTGIQTWNQESSSWQALDLADTTSFTGEMRTNVDKWAEDIKNGGDYDSTMPEHQAKFDKQYQFLMKTYLLSQTDFLNQNAEVIKSWGYNSPGEMDAQHVSWLFDKYNIENHQASILLPSEVLNSFKEKAAISYKGEDGKYYQGLASDFKLDENNSDFEVLWNACSNGSPIELEIGGINISASYLLSTRSWGSLMAVKIIPGVPKEEMIAEKLLFGPSPKHPVFSTAIRIVNFEDIPSTVVFNGPTRFDIENMPGASFPNIFAAHDIFDVKKKWILSDFLSNLGNQVSSSGSAQNLTKASGETVPVGTYFPLAPHTMIPGNMVIGFLTPDYAEAQVWPWDLSQ